MKDNIQPCEVIESNLLDPTKETDLKTEFAQPIKNYQTGGTIYLGISPIQQAFNEMQRQQDISDIVKKFNIKPFILRP